MIEIGDRVEVDAPDSALNGDEGIVRFVDLENGDVLSVRVEFPDGVTAWFDPVELAKA